MLIKPPKDIFFKDDEDIEFMNPQNWKNLFSHDPGIFKDNDCYYVFSTHNCQIRKSKDLINWEWVGTAFETPPENAVNLTGVETLWAPDIIKKDNEYWIYYSASSFGKNRSLIGLGKSKSIEGPYEDCGIVVESFQDGDFNAIDANIVYDVEGEMWMVYGSFWNGIYLIKLDKTTGKPSEVAPGKLLAGRNKSVDRAIEGPYIVYNETFKKYYLFVSYDSLFKNYHVRVGRADKIDGPYLDSNGFELTNLEENPNFVGNKVLGAYKFMNSNGWAAPGHNSVLKEKGEFFIVHHARDGGNIELPYLHIRKIFWSEDGWPLVSPERYAGEENRIVEESEIFGKWELLEQNRENNIMISSFEVELNDKKEVINDGKIIGFWKLTDKNRVEIRLNEERLYKGVLSESWDWEKDVKTIILTGIDKQGISLWGKKSNYK